MTACSGRDDDAMWTKAGIERAVVEVLRKLGFLEGAPGAGGPYGLLKRKPSIEGRSSPRRRLPIGPLGH
jgi:hypothetical protein